MYATNVDSLDAASHELAVDLLDGASKAMVAIKAYLLARNLLREFPTLDVRHIPIQRAHGYFSDEEYHDAADRPDVLNAFSVATALIELSLDSVGSLVSGRKS